jgi:hypothetical protein
MSKKKIFWYSTAILVSVIALLLFDDWWAQMSRKAPQPRGGPTSRKRETAIPLSRLDSGIQCRRSRANNLTQVMGHGCLVLKIASVKSTSSRIAAREQTGIAGERLSRLLVTRTSKARTRGRQSGRIASVLRWREDRPRISN